MQSISALEEIMIRVLKSLLPHYYNYYERKNIINCMVLVEEYREYQIFYKIHYSDHYLAGF